MSAFSNGTEFEAWRAAWCATCVGDLNEDCGIVLDLYTIGESQHIKRGPMWSPQTVNYCAVYERRAVRVDGA